MQKKIPNFSSSVQFYSIIPFCSKYFVRDCSFHFECFSVFWLSVLGQSGSILGLARDYELPGSKTRYFLLNVSFCFTLETFSILHCWLLPKIKVKVQQLCLHDNKKENRGISQTCFPQLFCLTFLLYYFVTVLYFIYTRIFFYVIYVIVPAWNTPTYTPTHSDAFKFIFKQFFFWSSFLEFKTDQIFFSCTYSFFTSMLTISCAQKIRKKSHNKVLTFLLFYFS